MASHHGRRSGLRADPAVALDSALGLTNWWRLPQGAVRGHVDGATGRLATLSMAPDTAGADDPASSDDDATPNGRIVLVPGITGSTEDFILMMPTLAAAGYRVDSYDLAGQYRSAEAGIDRERLDLDDVVGDLIAVLEAGPPAHLLGYSFGGLLAQVALQRRPDLVRSLTLLSTPPAYGQVFRGVKIIGPLSWFGSARVSAWLMVWGVLANMNGVDRARLAFVRSRFAFTRRSTVTDAMRVMRAAPDCRAEVAASAIPKMVAVGTSDLWSVRRHSAFANSLGAQLVVYPTGHSPCETTPHQLSRDLLALYGGSGAAAHDGNDARR